MMLKWLCLAAVAGCGFGDNAGHAAPDAGAAVDARAATDALADAPPSPSDAAAATCTLVPQAGCSGATPACDIDGVGGSECRAVTSQGTSNNHCASVTACRAGYTCIGTDTASEDPWCARMCITDSHCTGVGSRCVNGLVDENANPVNVTVCSNACNPVTQSGCPSGMGCLARNDAGGDYTDCRYMDGIAGEGQACASSLDCWEGAMCVTIGGVSTCRSYCADSSDCASGDLCSFFATDPLVIGGVEYGICN